MINDIIFAVKRGVDVRIVIPKVPDKKLIYKLTKLNCAHLIKKGVMCYSYSKGFIHQKNIVCDNEFAVVGSVNLDYRSFLHQFENGVLMYGCGECEEIKKDFEEIFSVSKLITQKDIKLNLFEKIFGAFLKIIAPLL